MSEQFPVGGGAANSKEALSKLMETLEKCNDSRLPVWIVQWARDACEQKIIDTENKLMRRERFGYTKDAEYSKQYLKSYQEAYKIIVALSDYVRALSNDDFARGLTIHFQQYNKPDIIVGEKEIKNS